MALHRNGPLHSGQKFQKMKTLTKMQTRPDPITIFEQLHYQMNNSQVKNMQTLFGSGTNYSLK